MRNSKVKLLAMNAIIAAIYVTVTTMTHGISFGFGPIVFRLSQMLLVLPYYNKDLRIGVILGVIISNMSSPIGPIDMVVGATANYIPMLFYERIPSKWLIAPMQGLSIGLLIGTMLHFMIDLPWGVTVVTNLISTIIMVSVGIIVFDLAMGKETIRNTFNFNERD